MERRTARMSTAADAGNSLLKERIKQMKDQIRELRQQLVEKQRSTASLQGRVIQAVTREFQVKPGSLSGGQTIKLEPEMVDKAVQATMSPASGSVSGAQAPLPAPPTAAEETKLLP